MASGENLNFFIEASMHKTYPRLALLGCGLMGRLLSHRLLVHGYPLMVYNRTPGKAAALVEAGAQLAATPQDAARDAMAVITVVSDDNALRSVLYGPDGALTGEPVPSLIISLGTHSPDAIIELARMASEHGASLVDAPMSGSVHDAQHGTLGFMVGAEIGDLTRARPVLEAIGAEILHFGMPGTGSSAKLALNLLVGTMARGLGEAIAMLEAQQLSVTHFLTALKGSGLASPLYQRIGERYLQADTSARFSLASLEKDMQLVIAHAQALGVSHDMADAVMKPLRDMDEADKQRDYSALLSWSMRHR
jgi:3-hydroxyisobutyrate dehydrogenase-like beta-hydroxyacid dehydrogenase